MIPPSPRRQAPSGSGGWCLPAMVNQPGLALPGPRAHVLPRALSVVPTAPQGQLSSQRLGWGSALFHELLSPQAEPLRACQFSVPWFPLLKVS